MGSFYVIPSTWGYRFLGQVVTCAKIHIETDRDKIYCTKSRMTAAVKAFFLISVKIPKVSKIKNIHRIIFKVLRNLLQIKLYMCHRSVPKLIQFILYSKPEHTVFLVLG